MCACSLPFCAVLAVTVLLLSSIHAHAVVELKINQEKKCDLYDGSWVFDKSYPLYDAEKCPLILQQFNCMRNGRPDRRYQKYKWQPNNCNLPRWDGREFASRVRGKRIMFVGDSISTNQWQSLACIIRAAYPRAPYSPATTVGPISTILFPKLNMTLMYMRNAYIVDIATERAAKVLKLNSVAASAKQWLKTDILIFNTWHWWLHTGRKQPWDLIKDGKVIRKDMDRLKAYERALRTWTRWIDKRVDTNKINIFFQGVSPDHWNGSNWGRRDAQRCWGQEVPLKQAAVEGGGGSDAADIILKKVLRSMKKPVHLLDINRLSRFRVDGHPSVYGNSRKIGMDCTHWCLPGVPDTWNQLLYATLLKL
ncbi:protein trichome birefringence-like 43 [Sesamum alatum]|uniref:Protein trichome birefringence-like 43 n=1 Tax=Sesamum alatum TaxID=300844 RepID=A0AAE1XZG6_9LAMI|nr:protein trichome birefringence-like 43 [Sesamum alatum]